MDVSAAVATRKSVRALLDTPVSDESIQDLSQKAARAPSVGNLQRWRIIYGIGQDTMSDFQSFLGERQIGPR